MRKHNHGRRRRRSPSEGNHHPIPHLPSWQTSCPTHPMPVQPHHPPPFCHPHPQARMRAWITTHDPRRPLRTVIGRPTRARMLCPSIMQPMRLLHPGMHRQNSCFWRAQGKLLLHPKDQELQGGVRRWRPNVFDLQSALKGPPYHHPQGRNLAALVKRIWHGAIQEDRCRARVRL